MFCCLRWNKALFVFLFGLFVFTSCFNDGTKEVTENNGGIGGEIHDWDNGGVEDIIATED